MLRYKKHKRLVDGQGSGVGVMDDADREVSSFTDRAFRSLCVAEEEPYNDVPRLPSPIRGMPLSTKYHLGIFNLSVRKTQPLAQLPTLPGHRGKWAPTFQPLLNRTRNGVIDGRTNINKLSAPEPRGYRQRSKVSSLIKTFDNIENELPDDAPLQFITPIPKISQKGNLNSEEIVSSDTALQADSQSEITDEGKKACLVLNENHNLRRRTAREVFLETQADKCSILSGSPCSLGSPLLDTAKQTMKQKEHLRRTSFLHSENSAFKSWSDFKKRIIGGEESDSSIPGTPPIFGSVTPSSPLLPRMLSGIRAREAGLEHGFSSPASTVSSSYDAVQILRTVPPLPSKKLGKQNKESSHRTGAPRIPLEVRIQEEEMQIDMTSPSSFKEHSKWTRDDSISKLPLEFKQEPLQSSCSPTKINEVHAMSMTPKQARKPGDVEKGHEASGAEEHRHSSGRIKSIIQQIEKEAIGDLGSPRLSQRHGLMELPRDDTTDTLSDTSCVIPPSSNAPLQSTKNVPPQGTSHVPQSSGQVLLQDSNHIWSEVENLVSLQGFSHMPLKDTINIPLQGTSHIPPEGNNHDPFHEQTQAEPQGTRHIDPQGSSQVNHQGINHVEPQGSSPAPLQDIRHTPTQGTSQAATQGTSQAATQGTSHVTPKDTIHVTPKDTIHATPQGTIHPTPQGTIHPTPQGTIHPTPQGTIHPTPQGTIHPTPHGTIHPTPQGTIHPTPHGTIHPTPHGTIHPTPHGTIHPTPHGTIHPTPHGTIHPTPQGTIHPTPQGTIHPTPQGTIHPTLQGTIHPTPQGTIHPTPQSTIHPTPQGTIHPTPQSTIHPTPQGTIYPTPQGTIPPTPQGTIHPTPQGTIHPTPQGIIHPTLQGTIHPTPQGTIHPTLQGTSYITPQDITPQDISQVLPQSSTHIPPWRRTKVTPRLEADERLYSTNHHKEKALVDNITTNNENEKPTISSFNITNLLTPVIRRKNIKEALEEMPMMITPPPAEAITLKEKEVSLYRNRDDYKSKATSLLFNLKDMRKRVKSTYNPASTIKNGIEKSQVGDGRTHENVNPIFSGMEKNKLVTETENVPHITAVQNVGQVERETKLDFLGNAADNYLSLSSPQQVIETSREENEETIQDGIQKDRYIPEINKEFNKLNQPEEKIRKVAENPSLKIYNKEDIAQELTESDHSDTVQKEKEHFTLEENSRLKVLNENDSLEQAGDIPTIKINYMLENNKETSPAVLPKTEDYAIDLEQVSNSREIDKTRSCDFVEEEKTEKCIDNTKDELQYYAVSSINMEESRGTGGSDNEKDKVEEKVVVVSDKQIEETICIEELQRPTSITQFKPNLFHIKDNKIKPCPVTKSVRLALLRSRSEDSLVCRKEEVISHFEDRGELELERFTPKEKEDINIGIIRTDNVKNDICPKGKVCELSTRPASETPKRNNREFNHIKMQEEETENFELLKKLCSLDAEWRRTDKVKTEKPKAENCCNGLSSSRPEGPFFHPVETCVSEVTGLSPECNTLLAQNVCDSGKDLVNGDLGNSPLLTAESPHYSPLENNFLQFEDAVAFSEEIACSTINSPMSDSVTCSIVTSPMSVNTQSSGFTTALSALEDLPSPSSAGTNCRNGKFNFPTPDKPVITLIGNLEAQSTDCIKQPKENVPAADTQKTHTGKPPAVPPKTEKALRRAKRLTKKRRKTEGPQRMQEGEEHESEFVLDVPSPGIITPASMIPSTQSKVTPYINNNLQADGFRSASSTPSFPVTQRKLLQDPDSGQYFVVDIPIHYKIKTFFDPETGKYLQVSLPPSERETPTLDTLNSQFLMYPGLPTLSVSSISSLKGSSEYSAPRELEKESWEEIQKNNDCSNQYIESAFDSHDQSMTGTPQSIDRNMSRSRSPDIISMKDLEDFAMEAIS